MIILLRIKIFLFILILAGNYLFAQKQATPLEPQAPPQQTEVGIVFGLGNNLQSGIYQPKCDSCQFEGAQGFGITAGAVFIRDFITEIQWGATLTFSTLNSQTSYLKTDSVKILKKPPSDFEYRAIPFRNLGEYQVAEITLNPFLQWSPYSFIYLRMGIGASLLTDYKFKQLKELLKFKDTLSGGEIVDLIIDNENPRIKTVENNSIAGTNVLQFSLEPVIGFNFEISNQIYFSPSFSYSFPLTKFSNQQSDFNLNKWRILFELRLALQLRNIKND